MIVVLVVTAVIAVKECCDSIGYANAVIALAVIAGVGGVVVDVAENVVAAAVVE